VSEASVTTRWEDRLVNDRRRAARNQSVAQRAITEALLERSMGAGAVAVALTGSTARARRTTISDLDYHLVGPRPDLAGLPGDVDVIADSPERFERRLAEGDDFIQWTLRHGCVLHDPDGVMRAAWQRIEREHLWPDVAPKFERAAALVDLAVRVLEIEDREAAQEHVRAALTSLARGLLLADGTFPLARAELSDQLRRAGHGELGEWLRRSIYEQLSLSDLGEALELERRINRLALRR